MRIAGIIMNRCGSELTKEAFLRPKDGSVVFGFEKSGAVIGTCTQI